MIVRKQGVLKAIMGASFLMTLTLILLFFYFQTLVPGNKFFPEDTQYWNQVYTTYLVAFTLILITGVIVAPSEMKALATANYWKNLFMRFIPSAILTYIILMILRAITTQGNALSPLTSLAYVPTYILITHLFLVAQIEEIMFAGITYESVRKKYNDTAAQFVTMGAFSIFHYSKTGSLLATAIYLPLRYYWNYISNNGTPLISRLPVIGRFFGPTPETQQANAGSHFAYNAFITGIR